MHDPLLSILKMSKRNKLQKFADLLTFPNVYENYNPKYPKLIGQNEEEIDLKGKWNSIHFKNEHPITLELACGRGEYSLGLARMYPKRNFIGVDVKGARIWKGAGIALEEQLNNVAFLRTRIEQIELFFAPHEVQEIWITFPDPFLKASKENRRLTSSRFLSSYRNILNPDGLIHLKTDSPELYEFTLEVLETHPTAKLLFHHADIYSKPLPAPELDLKTYYEHMHLEANKTIKYVKIGI